MKKPLKVQAKEKKEKIIENRLTKEKKKKEKKEKKRKKRKEKKSNNEDKCSNKK